MINEAIKAYITEHEKKLIATRRKLHSEPELSWEEENTTAFICDQLDQLGIPCLSTKPTSVIAEK